VLLTEAEHLPLAEAIAKSTEVELVVIEEPEPADRRPVPPPPPETAAFVLHTSGTTGTPKAVAYRQAPLAVRSRVNAGLCQLGPGAVYATASPLHHIAGLGNHAVALAAGATIVPVPRFSVDGWADLASLSVTHALTVPTMIELLLDADALALPSLRVMQYGASPIHPETLRRTQAALPNVGLVNIFGQTEGSPITCLTSEDHRRILSEDRDELLESVGRAAPGVQVWIERPDAHGVGEVCARADHFFTTTSDGVLHTGDLGRLDADGYLFLVGRQGDRIIRGGENIYPIEVEQVLEAHPDVREAAVVGLDDRHWGEVVCAFIVATDPDGPPSTEALRLHARDRLSGFKVPTEWTFVNELPRNPAGKVLRRRLRETAR
jgi:acyl-CoA synthetase (AMP-forming)/AMP-acid ligase II